MPLQHRVRPVAQQVEHEVVFAVREPARVVALELRGRQQRSQACHHAAPLRARLVVQAQGHVEIDLAHGVAAAQREGMARDLLQAAEFDLQHQLFAVGVPAQAHRLVGGNDGALAGVDLQRLSAGVDVGAAAQRHLHQHEVAERVGLDVDVAAVAQDAQRQCAHLGAAEDRIDIARAPHAAVRLQLMGHARVRLFGLARAEDLAPVQRGQLLTRPCVHGHSCGAKVGKATETDAFFYAGIYVGAPRAAMGVARATGVPVARSLPGLCPGPVHPISGVALAGKGAGCKAPVRSKAEALQARATPQTAPLPANPKGRSATAGHSALRSLRVRMHTRRHAP
ncbi:hypothetical protein D3C72_1215580 [compost metagenome]